MHGFKPGNAVVHPIASYNAVRAHANAVLHSLDSLLLVCWGVFTLLRVLVLDLLFRHISVSVHQLFLLGDLL